MARNYIFRKVFFFKQHKNQTWNELKLSRVQKSASMNSNKQIYWYETCSHRHSVLQQPYSVHTINLAFSNQINSAHLGVERGIYCD